MIPVLHEYQLASGVRAFSTTRQGGVSEGAYASFNINAYCGDDPACLEANLASLAQELGLPQSAILMPHQVHGEQHVCVEADFLSKSDEQQADLLDGVDIIMTPLRQVCVGVSTATRSTSVFSWLVLTCPPSPVRTASGISTCRNATASNS